MPLCTSLLYLKGKYWALYSAKYTVYDSYYILHWLKIYSEFMKSNALLMFKPVGFILHWTVQTLIMSSYHFHRSHLTSICFTKASWNDCVGPKMYKYSILKKKIGAKCRHFQLPICVSEFLLPHIWQRTYEVTLSAVCDPNLGTTGLN